MEVEARSMRMNLHTMSKTGYFIAFILFLVLFIISVIIGAFGPQVWLYQPKLTVHSSIPLETEWVGTVNVSRLNQRVTVYATVENPLYSGQHRVQAGELTFNYSVRGYSLAEDLWYNVSTNVLFKGAIRCAANEKWCTDQYLSNLTVINRPSIEYDAYEFTLRVENGENEIFPSVIYRLSEYNSKFTLFALWFRFVFLFITFVFIVIFAIKLRGFDWKDWNVEQRWVAVLLFGLLGYNNPFFALTIMVQGWFPVFLDTVLLASFLVLLLLFWLVMFDGIRTEPQDQTFKKFYLPKFILIGLFWVFAIIVYAWSELATIYSPDLALNQLSGYIFVYGCLLFILIVYALWLMYVVFRAISSTDSMPYLSLRLKFFGVFTLIVIVIVVAGVLFGAIGPVDNNAAQLLSFLSLFNLYIYILAFVYFPTREAGLNGSATAAAPTGSTGMVRLEELEEDDLDAQAVVSRGAITADPTSFSSSISGELPETPTRPVSNGMKINFGETPEGAQRYSSDEDEMH